MIYKMIFGDWSDDGHGKTETFIIDIDATQKELVEAYKKTKEEFGFGVEDVCDEYEDYTINPERTKILFDAGFSEADLDQSYSDIEEIDDDGSMWVDVGRMFDILMFMIKRQLPDLKYKVVADNYPILLGCSNSPLTGSEHVGYGVFHA